MTEVFLQATIFRHINRRIECPPEEKNTLWNNYFSCLQYLLPYSEVSVNYNTDCIIASLSETRRDWKFRLRCLIGNFQPQQVSLKPHGLVLSFFEDVKSMVTSSRMNFMQSKYFLYINYCALPNSASWCLECIYLMI